MFRHFNIQQCSMVTHTTAAVNDASASLKIYIHLCSRTFPTLCYKACVIPLPEISYPRNRLKVTKIYDWLMWFRKNFIGIMESKEQMEDLSSLLTPTDSTGKLVTGNSNVTSALLVLRAPPSRVRVRGLGLRSLTQW